MQQNLTVEMQHDFNSIQMLFKSNYLKVKTKFVIFGTPGKLRQIDASTCNMRINNNIVQRTKEVTYLGVIVDESLTWTLHVKYVAKKMSWAMGRLIKYLVPFKIKKMIYSALVIPNLEYCCLTWSATSEANLSMLQKTLNRCCRTVLNIKDIQTSTAQVFFFCFCLFVSVFFYHYLFIVLFYLFLYF